MTQNKSPILNPKLLCLSVLIPLSLVTLANARVLHPLSIIHEVGDVCNDLERCVEGTFCDPDGLCSCPEPGSQVFDTYRKKCVAQVFENCESSEDCTQFASCIPQWNQTLARFFGKCQCTGKYFKLPFESICGPRSKFGEPCNEHVNDINFQPCDLSQNLRCRGGQRNGIPYGSCLCENNATYVFDDYRRACVVRAGHPCFSQRSNHPASICVHGAKCQHFQKRLEKKGEMSSSIKKAMLKSKSTKEFLPHSQPVASGSLRCRCEAGFSKTAQGFCKPSFGGRCDHQRNECLEGTGLVCSNGECQCESPLYQIFDERVGKCLCKIGAACHHHHHRHNISSHPQHQLQQPLHSCVRHAHCHADVSEENSSTTTASVLLEGPGSNFDKSSASASVSASASLGECKCNPGFTKTLDGQCKLDYGSNCSLTNSNSNFIFGSNFEFVGDHGFGLRWGVQAECNNDVGLACQNGKCVCFDSKLVFDDEGRICVNRRADEFCGIFRDEMSGSDYRVGCMKSNHIN